MNTNQGGQDERKGPEGAELGIRSRPIFERPGRPEQSSRRILLVTYHFPPDPTVGARRWEKLAPFVAERGWGLDVITCAPPTGSDLQRLEALPHGVRVFGVPTVALPIERLEYLAWRLYRALYDGAANARSEHGISAPGWESDRRSLRSGWAGRSEVRWRLYTPRGLLRVYWAWLQYVRYRTWARQAASVAQTIVKPGAHISVVTSGPPHMTHAAGWEVSQRTGLPFVMDMRDPWSLSVRIHESLATPLWLRLARRYERITIGQAALVVANTEAAREALAAAYPCAADRFITVMNGSDDDPIPPSKSVHRFTIAYAGTIYLERHPRSLFRAAGRVIRELGLAPADFGIYFMGLDPQAQHSLMELAREEGIADFTSMAPARPHTEALEFLARATMLVTFDADTITIPAKIFECVRFDAWLLALSDPGSATDRLLRATGADVVDPNDIVAIAAVIRRRYEEYRRGVGPRGAVADDRFSRRIQARILLDAIARLLPHEQRLTRRTIRP
jgi:hypothetical protein